MRSGRWRPASATDFAHDLSTLGGVGILLFFLRAYSLGGGTYTGIEAVSNGLQIMRDPKVQTGKRTMLYMAVSLAVTAGGLFLCYLLLEVRPVAGKTLNCRAGRQPVRGLAVRPLRWR